SRRVIAIHGRPPSTTTCARSRGACSSSGPAAIWPAPGSRCTAYDRGRLLAAGSATAARRAGRRQALCRSRNCVRRRRGGSGPDPVRELLFNHPKLLAVELLTTPSTAAVLAVRLGVTGA